MPSNIASTAAGITIRRGATTFFSMIHGEVDALYARLHHKKWYDEKMVEERECEMRVRLEEIEAREREMVESH